MPGISEHATRNRILIGAVVASLLLAASAFAFGGRHHRGHGPEHRARMVEKMLDRADATDAQRAEIEGILEAAHEEPAADREAEREAFHARALAILTAETVDRAAFDALWAEKAASMEQRHAWMATAIVEAANVLSQEQRVAVAEAMRERFEERGDRREHRHGQHD